MAVVEVNGYTIEPGANLEMANLQGANLKRADLEGANLKGAHLKEAYLKERDHPDVRDRKVPGANLHKARYDMNTTWPRWFNKKAAGVIFE